MSRKPYQPGSPVVLHTRVVQGSGGGPDKTILNSPRFLANDGYRMLCAYMHAPDDPGFEQLRIKAEKWQAPLVSVCDRGPLDWRILQQFLQICRRERVTIWHGHDYKSNLVGLLLRPFWPMHLVTTVHGWVHHTRRTPLYYAVDRLCLPHYEKVICVSEDLQKRCLAVRVPRNRCVLVENAIDTEEFRRRRPPAEAKRFLGFDSARVLIGAVGRLSAEKGFDLLIRAVDQLLSSGAPISLIIIGEGSEKPALENLIRELGRQSEIQLLGYRSDTRDLYEAMDVFALSSLREGLPNVVLEAMALEVPVVATRIAGVPRLVEDGKTGILLEPNLTEELVRGLRILIEQPDLRAQYGQAGRQLIEARYSFKRRMQKIKAIYDSLTPLPQAALKQPA